MVVRVLLVPLTSYRVLEYIDDFKEYLTDSLNNAGVENEVLVSPNVESVSLKCFNWRRKQYLAPCVLDELRTKFDELKGIYLVGVGYMDGYDHGLNFVFGEANPYTLTAVVFTKRLDPVFYGEKRDYNLYVERVAKEIVHELGHLLGLRHCSVRECVMSFSNSVYEVDQKTRFFCDKCKVLLKNIA